ncbi:hypothetical protein BCR33DRAFT_462707 [Rhizoclosmatium globosum]|uniref:Uncharacterized protein n=1 Tax=Rhizoclosmatium globosum TaxID=329046 RepID=A0A1Y2BS07_9FUNG|nr:hypothetical protein BCR33DRAFT_462707 [Rhizoclosmatium globosum]|eukprot:ORY37407.1 hypothetical protein BCR33DRAFT_462707 [Rhizoclosmatium globosum]
MCEKKKRKLFPVVSFVKMDPFAASSPTRPPRIGLTDVSNQGPAAETPHAKLRILSALPSMSSSTASDTSTATSTTTGAAAAAATTSTPRSQLLRDVSRSSSSIDPNASRSFEAGDASVAWPSASFLPDTSSASFSIHHHHHNQSNQSLQLHQSQQENRRETVAFFKAAAEKEKPHVPQFALLQQKEHPPKGNVQPLIERFNSMLPSPSSAQADTRDASQQPNISDDDVVHVLMGIGLPGRSKNTSSIKETPNTSISVENLLDQAPPSDEFNSSTFLATPAPLKHNTHQEHIIPAKKENDEAATSKNIPALSSSTTAAPMFTFPAPSSSSTLSFQSAIPVPTSSSGFNFTSAVSFGSNSADKKPAAFSFDSKATTAPFSKPFSFAAASKPLLFTQVPEKKEAINEPSNTFTFRPTATEKFAVNVTEEATKLKSDPPTSFFPPSRIEANESNDGPKPSFSFGLSSATSSTEKTKADVLELSKDSITDEKISTEALCWMTQVPGQTNRKLPHKSL